MRALPLAIALLFAVSGCALVPEPLHQPQVHNPFPQLTRVGVIFFNQSNEPTVNSAEFAESYSAVLAEIPGFEVAPSGVVQQAMARYGLTGASEDEFPILARRLGLDAILVGSVTHFDPYAPPECGIKVNWYAANPGFHPAPPGYGLPWGTPEEKEIPPSLVLAAEHALAREQLKTQTPLYREASPDEVRQAQALAPLEPEDAEESLQLGSPETGSPRPNQPAAMEVPEEISHPAQGPLGDAPAEVALVGEPSMPTEGFPPDWPDPGGFVPLPPSPTRPRAIPHRGAIISHQQHYNAADSRFTEQLALWWQFQDDPRFGGWQASLERMPDFIRFCCHLHASETLVARGGADEPRVIWRWPLSRYDQ